MHVSLAGEVIDSTMGVTFGLSTLTAAGFGCVPLALAPRAILVPQQLGRKKKHLQELHASISHAGSLCCPCLVAAKSFRTFQGFVSGAPSKPSAQNSGCLQQSSPQRRRPWGKQNAPPPWALFVV